MINIFITLFTWFLHTFINRHTSLSPKLHSRKKYLNMIIELKILPKAAQNYLHGRTILNYSCLRRLLSHHWIPQWSESQFHYQATFSITGFKLFNIRVKFSHVFYDWSTSISMWCLKFLLWERGRKYFQNRKIVLTMKHESTLHGVQCRVQRFPKAQWLHTNEKLENFLKLSFAPDL